ATTYKPHQGIRVRRGTILGLLVIVLAGIYTLLSHNTLRRGGPDWGVNIPFTGQVAVKSEADLGEALDRLYPDRPKDPAHWARVASPGDSAQLAGRAGQYVPRDEFAAEVARLNRAKKTPPSETGDHLTLDRYRLQALNREFADPAHWIRVTEANRAD